MEARPTRLELLREKHQAAARLQRQGMPVADALRAVGLSPEIGGAAGWELTRGNPAHAAGLLCAA